MQPVRWLRTHQPIAAAGGHRDAAHPAFSVALPGAGAGPGPTGVAGQWRESLGTSAAAPAVSRTTDVRAGNTSRVQHPGDFGIIDHDAYVFDPSLLERLRTTRDECMVGVFPQTSQRTGLTYALTHLLHFNTEALRTLMQKWRIDARQYRSAPPQVVALLARLGLGPRSYRKDYHTFFDTLHVLLAVGLAEGLKLRIEPQKENAPVMHVGGTSIGTHHTKNLFAL